MVSDNQKNTFSGANQYYFCKIHLRTYLFPSLKVESVKTGITEESLSIASAVDQKVSFPCRKKEERKLSRARAR